MAQLELKIGDKTYNKAWVDNVSSTSQISSDAGSVNYGVIPSTGNATMRDINGQIRADIESGVLPVSNAQTKVIINGNQIQEHITSDSDYDVIDRELTLQFSDRLSLLDKVTYEGMPLRDYSMTAYEMLDDVVGSYGGYCKNEPINWVKYQNGVNISTASASDVITVATGSGWEIIGTPIKVTPNKPHSIQYSIQTQTEYTVESGQGIAIQILNSVPKNSNCEDIALASAFLGTTAVDNIGTLNFISATDTVYLVVNFGYASDAQTIKVRVNSVRVDGKSLAVATRGLKYIRHSRNGYLDVTTQTIRDFLKSKILEYPYLPSASYRETIEKFCTLAQITLALDNDGDIYFYDARPCIKGEVENEVPKSYQIKNLNKTIFLKNKIDGVDIKQSRVKDENETAVPVYTASYGEPVSVEQATGGSTSGLFTPTSELGCTFNATERGQSGADKYAAYAGMSSSWGNYSVAIPKKSLANLSQVLDVWTTKDSSGNPYISYSTEYKIERQTFSFNTDANATQTPYNFEFTGYTSSRDYNEAFHKISHTASVSDNFSCTISITDRLYIAGMSVEETDDYYKLNVRLQQSTKWYDATSNYSQYLGYSLGNGTLYTATISGVTISVKGVKRAISFVEEDLSTPNIKSANNAVSIPTSELMQNASDVKAIRDNILEDYANGVPTADIDLFYDENNKINKGDIICFNDDLSKYGDMNLWRVTSKTLKYNGYPSLSLELQQQKSWHIIDYWNGSIKVDNISNGDFTADTATTKSGTITLPRAFGKNYYFRAIITYMVDDTPYNNDRSGIGSINDSQLLIGTLARIHCDLTISDDGTKVYYSAEEIYKKVGVLHYKGYVKSINIVVFRYTEFD